ncbi:MULTISPECIES: P-loop NTPase family protein [Pseudomonadaceae]|uniref:adenylate kinase n=1 Tax=Pseudomonadaceae TaxID=135621 RepID=UPI00084A31B5|nr:MULTISPECIES: adenylate kinase [Pseudomonas]OEC61501.1 adenylate kinase [Pseudomonas sp. ENNP23]
MQSATPSNWPGSFGQRISIVGGSGAGKTYLAKLLSQRLGLPHIEQDAIFHQPGWQPLPRDEFRERVTQALAEPRWVVEGSYSATRPLILARAETVIWLDLPRTLVMYQIVTRTLGRLLTRKTLWNGNRERLRNVISLDPSRSIILWSWTRHGLYRERVIAEQQDPANAGIHYIRIRSRADLHTLLGRLPGFVTPGSAP